MYINRSACSLSTKWPMKYICTCQFYFTIAEFAFFCFDPKIHFERDDSSENFFASHQFYLKWSNRPRLFFLFLLLLFSFDISISQFRLDHLINTCLFNHGLYIRGAISPWFCEHCRFESLSQWKAVIPSGVRSIGPGREGAAWSCVMLSATIWDVAQAGVQSGLRDWICTYFQWSSNVGFL